MLHVQPATKLVDVQGGTFMHRQAQESFLAFGYSTLNKKWHADITEYLTRI